MTDVLPETRYPSADLIECPYPFFDEHRAAAPVYRNPDTGAFIVFRHEDILWALKHNQLLVGANGPISYEGGRMITALEPPEHTWVRQLAFRPFTPKRLKAYEPIVRGFADALIDRFIDRGEVDLVEEFAIPLPAQVICQLTGFPTEGPHFEAIVDRLSIRGPDRHRDGRPPTETDPVLQPLRQMQEEMRAALEARLESPTDDILTELLQGQIAHSGTYDMPLMVTICTELLTGGVVTTAQMIANAMTLLLQHPDQLALVRSDERHMRWMFDEALRLESPVQQQPRIAAEDLEIAGVQIPKGSQVILVFASGSRDPNHFPRADEFDIQRPHGELKDHFGFGHGVHFCMGAPVARMEGTIAFQRLFARLGEIRLAAKNELTHFPNTHFRAVRHLYLEFDRA